MIAIWPDIGESHTEAAARTAPQLGTRSPRDRYVGSRPERAPSVLRTFYEQCQGWHDWNLTPCDVARRTAFNSWLYQHGEAWIEARRVELDAVLDALEARARKEAWCGTS